MGSCVVTEMRSREEREITFSTDSKILCNKNLGPSFDQVEIKALRDESGLASMRSKVYYSKQYSQAGVGAKENYQSIPAAVQASEEGNNPKIFVRQACKEDISLLTEEGCQSNCNGSLQNLHQLSCQSTRNNTMTMYTNTQTSIPFTSNGGMATSQSSSSLSCINPHFRNSNSFMSSSNISGQNQNTSICINGIAQTSTSGRRGSLLFRQKSQSPSKQRRNSSSRRTSMTTIDLSRNPVILLNSDISSNYQPQNSIEDILMLVNSKNADTNSIQSLCDEYIERKKIEYSCNDYTSDEFYNCIQDLAVALFKSQLQELGKYYLDKLVQHKKVITQKNLLKNLFEYQKKL